MFKEYDTLKKMIDDNLISFLPEKVKESGTVYEAMKYSLEAGGKRIRPVMLMAACEMSGGKAEDALPFACAIEYIHTYSLIHDDLPAMDDDELRRGKPTNHVVFGEAEAILAGDCLLNRAFEVMLQEILKAEYSKRENYIKAAECISGASGYNGIIGGQIADIESERNSSGGAEMLKFIHKNKTGALLKCAVLAGAYIAGADKDLIEDLGKFSELFGLEFQIADDILDVVGDVKELGKSIGSDERNGKLTYPSCFGMEETLKYYEEVHKKSLDIIKKYQEKGVFFIELSKNLYHRVK